MNMANDKLQELTDRLFNEGLSKGKEEGEKVLAAAREQADRILADARKEADRIVTDAGEKARGMQSKADSDIRMAASQAMETIRAEIQDVILARSVDESVDRVLGNDEFAKQVIAAVAKAFSTEKNCDMAMVLPETCKGSVESYVRNEVSKAIGGNLDIQFSKKINGGLRIGPKDGSYYISLTDATFKELIKSYLRPVTRKVLFGD